MQLQEGNVLTKVTRYKLQRKNLDTLFIEVHEIINKATSKFVAFPVQFLPFDSPYEQYIVYGNSESAVLEKLVGLIEDLDNEEIFPKKRRNRGNQ